MTSDRKKGYHDLKLFSFATIMAATDDFSVEKKLGQGGFGLVFKVTRLEICFTTDLIRFKNYILFMGILI